MKTNATSRNPSFNGTYSPTFSSDRALTWESRNPSFNGTYSPTEWLPEAEALKGSVAILLLMELTLQPSACRDSKIR